jgi:hypothetical protein
MRKFALTFFCLVIAAISAADDVAPPPFIAPPDDVSAAPPAPAINIEGGNKPESTQVPLEQPASAVLLKAASDEPTPIPSVAPSAAASAAPSPTPLETEGIKFGDEAQQAVAPVVDAGSASTSAAAPPAPVLNIGEDTSTLQPTITPQETSSENAAVSDLSSSSEASPALAADAPPPPVLNVPVESNAPTAPVVNPGSSYEQIGGQNEPPSWFFTPEPSVSPKENEGPAVQEAMNTATPQATETPLPPVAEAPAPETSSAASAELSEVPTVVMIRASDKLLIESNPPQKDILGETVEAEMKQAPKANPDEAFDVALLLGRGKELESQARYYEAWRTYLDVVKEHPQDLRGWGAMNSFYARRLTDRARKLEKEQRYYEAANLYRDIVTRDASVASAWWGLGSIFFKYHKKTPAIYCFEKVLNLKPDMPGLKHWLEQYRHE